ncbi:hypothetical protein LC574_34595, partial [Nostoc sp. CHAB 5715]|nr:hypothetical protein [Nostoc sp. CHAB 5715]
MPIIALNHSTYLMKLIRFLDSFNLFKPRSVNNWVVIGFGNWQKSKVKSQKSKVKSQRSKVKS